MTAALSLVENYFFAAGRNGELYFVVKEAGGKTPSSSRQNLVFDLTSGRQRGLENISSGKMERLPYDEGMERLHTIQPCVIEELHKDKQDLIPQLIARGPIRPFVEPLIAKHITAGIPTHVTGTIAERPQAGGRREPVRRAALG